MSACNLECSILSTNIPVTPTFNLQSSQYHIKFSLQIRNDVLRLWILSDLRVKYFYFWQYYDWWLLSSMFWTKCQKSNTIRYDSVIIFSYCRKYTNFLNGVLKKKTIRNKVWKWICAPSPKKFLSTKKNFNFNLVFLKNFRNKFLLINSILFFH